MNKALQITVIKKRMLQTKSAMVYLQANNQVMIFHVGHLPFLQQFPETV